MKKVGTTKDHTTALNIGSPKPLFKDQEQISLLRRILVLMTTLIKSLGNLRTGANRIKVDAGELLRYHEVADWRIKVMVTEEKC